MKNGIRTIIYAGAMAAAFVVLPAHALSCGANQILQFDAVAGLDVCVSAGISGVGGNVSLAPQSIIGTLFSQVISMGLLDW
jgi:hypothetical protein